MSVALEMYRSLPRYAAARLGGTRIRGLQLAPLRLVEWSRRAPEGEGWVAVRPRLAGICGSDLGALSGGTSLYFSGLVSLPFVPGHEIVGETIDGARVVVDPVLACEARGVEPPCLPCASGRRHLCERVTAGHLAPGLQTGYCTDTGGGWGEVLFAHRSQLHEVPDDVPDERAVLVEPLACALHAVRRGRVGRDDMVVIVGAGTIGLLTLIAVRRTTEAGSVVVAAKHGGQAELARRYGATDVIPVEQALGSVRRTRGAFRVDPERAEPFLLGGADVVFECAGSSSAIDLALRIARGRGRVVLAAMPPPADLSPAWFREVEVVGAYSGAGEYENALALAGEEDVAPLVGAAHPLPRWRDALEEAWSAGALGIGKVVFDLRKNS